jgi:hypothetical protein
VTLSLSNLGFRFFKLVVVPPLGIKGLFEGLLIVEDGAILIGIFYPGEGI